MTTQIKNPSKTDKPLFIFLIVTAFTCGSLIMVVEVIGSKVIGPFFGVSLFVWTSLIAVTMISLAIGYALGGYLSDRKPSPEMLYTIILFSGIFVLLIPFCKSPVLKYSMSLGLRTGSFVSSMILLGPSLILLGCVSPYLVKIFLRELSNVGRTVGTFYAISTIGSVIGTAMSGFFLVAYLSVTQIFYLTGTLLILLTSIYFVFFRKKLAFAPLLILPLSLFMINPAPPVNKTMANGTQVQVIEKNDSFYGNVKVVDYRKGFNHYREMMIDGSIQGGLDMQLQHPFYAYPYFLSIVPTHINPKGKEALVVGLGPGIIPNLFESQGVRTDVVDIDPVVIDLAKRYFNFKSTGEIHIEDARYFLSKNSKMYDYLILDVFGGDTSPAHIVSLEAFQLMKKNLNKDGVLGINFVANARNETIVLASVKKTLKAVFQNVELVYNFDPRQGAGNGNISIFAYDGEFTPIVPSIFASSKFHPSAQNTLLKFNQFESAVELKNNGTLLTDDYNPIDYYSVTTKEWHRQWIINNTDWDVLIQ